MVAVLKTLGAPKRLSTLIAGESLLNDGSQPGTDPSEQTQHDVIATPVIDNTI